MSRVSEIIYLGRDNTNDVLLKNDGAIADLGPVSRIDLVSTSGKWSVSSITSPNAFDWGGGDGMVRLALGGETIPTGTHRCYLVVYDPTNTDGIVWDDLLLIVKRV